MADEQQTPEPTAAAPEAPAVDTAPAPAEESKGIDLVIEGVPRITLEAIVLSGIAAAHLDKQAVWIAQRARDLVAALAAR